MGAFLPLFKPWIMDYQPPALKQDIPTINIVIKQPVEPEKQPKLYRIVEKDNLTKIATAHQTSVERLWQANTQLTDPNTIEVNQELRIPESDEVLIEREMPVTIKSVVVSKTSPRSGGFSSGNSYQAGQCVWFIKNMRPEIPNNWGSAGSWLGAANSQGWPTGSTPKVGAVGWTSGHVVLITAVNSDGTVSYTDMNGRWVPFEVGYGTKPASYYQYIY